MAVIMLDRDKNSITVLVEKGDLIQDKEKILLKSEEQDTILPDTFSSMEKLIFV